VDEGVAFGVTAAESASTAGGRLLLANIHCLNLVHLALLIDHLNVIFMHLQYQPSILSPVVVDQIY